MAHGHPHDPFAVEETWTTELEALGRYAKRAYILTLHPHQIAHPGRLAVLERVLDRAAQLGARFRTCADVANECLRAVQEVPPISGRSGGG